MKKYILFFGTLLFIINCSKEDGREIGATTYEVDPTFEPYVQEFITEGAKRGHNIDFSDTGLKVEFSEMALPNANGLCYLGQHHIVIDKGNWFRFSERFRSYLLFHELGHCELDRRQHRNEKFSDQTWKSIMKGSPFTGIEGRIPVTYFGFRKDYYIDELFDPNTPDPAWSKITFDYNASLNRKPVLEKTDVTRLNERFNTPPQQYELEAAFTLLTPPATYTRLEWGTSSENYYILIQPGWGYYIGVTLDNLDNHIFYSNNTTLFNGRPIEKITIRQEAGVEQIFINEQFIFHLDALPKLEYYQLDATNTSGTFDTSFDIERFEFNGLE